MAPKYKYDVTLSFASEDREYVSEIANHLMNLGVSIFYDYFEKSDSSSWGIDLYSHLNKVYKEQSKFTVVFISRNYSRKLWTQLEHESARKRFFNTYAKKILPIRIDDSQIVGITDTIAYLDAKDHSILQIARLIAEKVSHTLDEKEKNQIDRVPNTAKLLSAKEKAKRRLPLCLYTVQTKLAFKVNEKYYNNTHYVWCSNHFDISKKNNPRSSDPISIYNEIKMDTLTRDLHSAKIGLNKAGIIKGGGIKEKEGVISKNQFNEIVSIVESTPISDFIPLVYVIPTKGIENLIEDAPVSMKANPFSKEYIIKELKREMFDVINIDDEYFAED